MESNVRPAIPFSRIFGGGRTPNRILIAVGAVAAGLALSYAFKLLNESNQLSWMYDMKVFREAGRRVLDGRTVYWERPRSLFTHTPFNALLTAPPTLLPLPVVAVVWNAITACCLLAITWVSLGVAGVTSTRVRLAAALLVAVAALRFDPIATDLLLGQMNTVCALLLMVDLLVLRDRRWCGLITGALAGLYLVPGLFAVFLLLIGRYRAVLAAAAAFAATTAIGFVFLPGDSVHYWSGLFLKTGRVGQLQNPRAQSVLDVLARFLHTDGLGLWSPVIVVLLCAAGLALAVRMDRSGDRVGAVMVVALTTLLATPITWNHNFLWVVPVLLLLGVAGWRRRSAALLALVAVSAVNFFLAPYNGVPFTAPADLHLDLAQSLRSATFAINALILVVALAVARTSPDRDPVRPA